MSKEKLITAALAQLVKILVGSKLLKEVFELVKAYMNNSHISGIAKKEAVTRELNDVKDELKDIVDNLSGWAVSVAIDVAHAWLKARD